DKRLDHAAALRVGTLDHGRFQNGRVADQAALDLEWRDAVAARLDDVVVAALEPEVAVGVAAQYVAGIVPRPAENLGRSLRLAPVLLHHARMAVAAHAQDAFLTIGHRLQIVVEQCDHGAGVGLPAAARLERSADAVVAIDHALAHADAVE